MLLISGYRQVHNSQNTKQYHDVTILKISDNVYSRATITIHIIYFALSDYIAAQY